jgi:hypothetical protein
MQLPASDTELIQAGPLLWKELCLHSEPYSRLQLWKRFEKVAFRVDMWWALLYPFQMDHESEERSKWTTQHMPRLKNTVTALERLNWRRGRAFLP